MTDSPAGASATHHFLGLPPEPRITWPSLFPRLWIQVLFDAGTTERLIGVARAQRVLLPDLAPLHGKPLISGRLEAGGDVVLAAESDGGIALAFDPDLAVSALIERGSFTHKAPWYARVPFDYRRLPPSIRSRVRDLLGSRANPQSFPSWPLDLSVELIRGMYRAAHQVLDGFPSVAFWPDGKKAAVALTFDVDSQQGQERATRFADELGSSSLAGCFYVVGAEYPVDTVVWEGLVEAGFEVGLHGDRHDHRLAFLPRSEIVARLRACELLINTLGMTGFRAPSFLRTRDLIDVVGMLFRYDSSVPHSHLIPYANGCGSLFPFPLRGTIEVPATLSPDGLLLSRGLEPSQILAAWLDQLETIATVGGVAVFLAHPEIGFSDSPEMRAVTTSFFSTVAARPDLWCTTPARIAQHWRDRNEAILGETR